VKDLDDDMIVDNLLVYWFAAYDTTSTTLTWILKLLIDNPEVSRRVQVTLVSKHKDKTVLFSSYLIPSSLQKNISLYVGRLNSKNYVKARICLLEGLDFHGRITKKWNTQKVISSNVPCSTCRHSATDFQL
jgi:hypothetical protein